MESDGKYSIEFDEQENFHYSGKILKTVFIFNIFLILHCSFKKSKNTFNLDYIDDDYNILDTINPEELNKARVSFNQYIYNDIIDSSKSISYNLFIPEIYSNNKKYPLVVYIGDARMSGKKATSPLTQGVGGIIWATESFQKRHKCFVLVPYYNEIIIDDANGYFINENINITIRLISLIKSKYNIDPKRIYGIGQSMGAMTILYLLSNYQNLFSAGLIVEGQWKIDDLEGLINSTFTYIVSAGDKKAFNGQKEVKNYFDSKNIKFGSINNLNAQENVNILDIYVKNIYSLGYRHNFINYAKGTVFTSKNKIKNEHLASFKYGYRIEAVKDWLFSQSMKINEDYYISKDGRFINSNFCEKTNEENLCIKCIEGYYLTSDKLSCTKEINCKIGDGKRGLCNECKENYYLDMKDRKCKSNIEKKEYKFCKTVIRGICTECEKYYYLDKDNKCSQSENCLKSSDNICKECINGFHLGKDNKCINIERCIYSKYNECIECEDGYYYERVNKTCKKTNNKFLNCKANYYHRPKKCAVCKNNYYLSMKDYLCYDNTKEGPFYKCQISNSRGDLCQNCIENYFIGQIDSKCSKIPGCIRSENVNKCLECQDAYCLDDEGNCIMNFNIAENSKKYYYRCKSANDKEKKCKVCENNLIPNKDGICYDDIHCIDKDKEGICQKCQKENPDGYISYCLNLHLGCIDSFIKNCIRCDDIFNLDICTKCEEGYEIDKEGQCIKRK